MGLTTSSVLPSTRFNARIRNYIAPSMQSCLHSEAALSPYSGACTEFHACILC